ncbi:agmatine deiminase family protein [Bradyrhizobium sp. NBAIM14]|uniref:agmatine deiminase family protein n=1 Tax=Bradyrhizobium sp. NBAIM14 TaxID=2793814 RepID=UPI001CD77FE7|nr:agmatine deiminase family protein [Bradyrhizobium sp. NBAIM14]MCA1501674.1 agmatine deiminase family protein [Bradyrhizobium sp. NBAIM14]
MARQEVSDGSEVSASIGIPADFETHARTIMAWAVHREWGGDRERVERELETVIRAIAEDEPVTLLTPPDLVGAAKQRGFGVEVEIVPAPVDDVWMRDIAPVFAKRGGDTVAIDLNFNGWDGSRSGRPGDRLARTHDFGVPVIGVPFVGEGGAFITDGAGLAVATRSCLLSRNPHLDEAAIERSFGHIGIHTVNRVGCNLDRGSGCQTQRALEITRRTTIAARQLFHVSTRDIEGYEPVRELMLESIGSPKAGLLLR